MKTKRYGACDEVIKAYKMFLKARANLTTKILLEAMRKEIKIPAKNWGKVKGVDY